MPTTANNASSTRALDFLVVLTSTPANNAAKTTGQPLKCVGRADACALVETVTVTGIAVEALLSEAFAGLIEHDPPAKAQLKETVPVNPLIDVSARL